MGAIATNATIGEHLVFRSILQAVARPGTVHRIVDSSSGHGEVLAMFAASLLDSETGICAATDSVESVVEEVSELTGCPKARLEVARWVVVAGRDTGSVLDRVDPGSPDYPDESATILYLVDAVSETGGPLAWSGPGIPGTRRPEILGLDPHEWTRLRAKNSSYPLGVDCFFLDASGRIVALPRSTRLEGGF